MPSPLHRSLLVLACVVFALCCGCEVRRTTFFDAADLQRPRNLTYAEVEPIYVVGRAAEPNLPAYEGAPARFTVAPRLPAGLTLDDTTGVLHGAPLVGAEAADYEITATNPFGTASVTLRIHVRAPRADRGWIAGDGTVQSLAIDRADGSLRLLRHERVGVGATSLALHPDGAWLHVATAGDQNLQTIRIENGELTTRTIAGTGRSITGVHVHPSGRFVYALHGPEGYAVRYLLDERSGRLQLPLQVGLGADVTQLLFEPSGRIAIAIDSFTFLVGIFQIDADLGVLRPLTVLGTAPGPKVAALDTVGGRLVVADRRNGESFWFRFDEAAQLPQLVARTLLPVPPSALAFDPRTGTLLMTDREHPRLRTLTLRDGVVVQQSQTALSALGTALAVDPAGVAYVTTQDARVAAVAFDAVGLLAPPRELGLDAANGALALEYGAIRELTTQAAYVACGDGTLRHVAFDNAFRPSFTASHHLPEAPRAVATPLAGERVFALTPHRLEVLPIDANTRIQPGPTPDGVGAPFPVPFVDAVDLVVAPNGDSVFVADRGRSELVALAVVGSHVSERARLPLAVEPRVMTADPGGTWIAVVGAEPPTLTLLRREPTGGLRHVDAARCGADPVAVAFAPGGRRIYVANRGDATITRFGVAADGRLSILGLTPVASRPVALAVDARGQHLLIAHDATPTVAVHRLDADGHLGAARPHPMSLGPVSLAFVPGTQILLVACPGEDAVVVASFDPATASVRILERQPLPRARGFAFATGR
jgi:6-phosphogluconolactonase (cycloisomerase 2 family)